MHVAHTIVSSAQNQEALKSLLNQEGFRLTTQRQRILDIFNDAQERLHWDVETIYHRLAADGETISYSTIYRALRVMVRLGLLRELELAEGRKHYELTSPLRNPHHHLVCNVCGALKEFEADSIESISLRQARQHDYRPLDCQFMVYGICPDCQKGASP